MVIQRFLTILSTMFIGIVILIMPLKTNASTVLYCQEELTVGFIKDSGNGKWRKGNFNSDERYTIKFNDDFSFATGIEDSYPFACQPAFSHKPYAIVCREEKGSSFIYDRNNKRFLRLFVSPTGGFVSNKSDSDVFSAGTCVEF